MARAIALAAALAGALAWAILAILPPAARGMDTPAADFSAARALVHIEALSHVPRPAGSAGNAQAVAYLSGRLSGMGAEVSEQAVPLGGKALDGLSKWSGRVQKDVTARNLIGLFHGRDPRQPALLLMAHHDSVWGSPGAADDAIGMAVALETARAIRARGQTERDLILLFTDSEELGLDGAEAFFGESPHPLAARIGAIINMEARGAGGRANMFETGPGNANMMRLYAERVERPATNSLSVLIYDLMPNYTDYTIAKRKGVPGFNLATLDRAYAYHSPMATAATVDPDSVQDMGDQALALASALGFSAELPMRSANAAFADLLGRVTIVYPPAAGWAILLLAAILIGAPLWRQRISARAIAHGMIQTGALLLHGALLLFAFNALSGSGSANYYDRLAALPRLELIAALLVAALLMLSEYLRRPEGRLVAVMVAMALMWVGLLTGGPLVATVVIALAAMGISWFLPASTSDRGEGAVLLLLAAALIVQVAQPTIGPLLQWPLLLAAIAMAARSVLPPTPALAIGAVVAAIGLGHLLAQAHFIFLGIGAELPAVMMVLLFAGWPLLQPLWPDHFPRWLPALALVAALVLALWVRLDPIAPSVPAYSIKNPVKTKD